MVPNVIQLHDESWFYTGVPSSAYESAKEKGVLEPIDLGADIERQHRLKRGLLLSKEEAFIDGFVEGYLTRLYGRGMYTKLWIRVSSGTHMHIDVEEEGKPISYIITASIPMSDIEHVNTWECGPELTEEVISRAIEEMPFMPTPGPTIPGPIARAFLPEADIVAAPVSDYGGVVRDLVVEVVEKIHTSPYFKVVDPFDETGWSSEDVIYSGKLLHTPSDTLWYAEVGVSFEWRKPETATKEDVNLLIIAPDWWAEERSEYYTEKWADKAPSEINPTEMDTFIKEFLRVEEQRSI